MADPQQLPPAQQDIDNAPPPDQAQPQQNAPQLTDVSFMSDTPAPTKGSTAPSLLDYGKEAWRSAVGTGSSLLSAASYTARQLGASPDTVQHIENARQGVDDYNKSVFNSMTQAGQSAASATLFPGTDDEGRATPSVGDVGLMHYALMNGASFVPDALMAILPGGVAAKLGMRIAGEVGGAIASAATTGGTFGSIQLGDAYHSFVKDVDAVPDDQYRGSNPAYAQMRDSGMSEHDAKAAVVKQGMTQLGALQFGIGAITGAGMGHLLTGGAAGGAGRGLLARLGLGSVQGAADMGAQSGGGNAAQQVTSVGAGLQPKFDTEQLATSFASGALGGAVMGAATGAIHTGAHAGPVPDHEETEEAGPSTTMVAPDTAAALNTQLDKPQPAAAQAAEPPTAPPAAAPSPQAATASPAAAAGPSPTVPEPKADLIAQLKAVGDTSNPKDTAFIPAGGMAFTKSIRDAIPENAQVVSRPGVGRLITTSAEKAEFFKSAPNLGDDDMAELLGYPESKNQVAAAGGSPTVVQGRDAQGNVVHESVVSQQGVPAAVEAAQAVAPEVHQLTPEDALARRQLTDTQRQPNMTQADYDRQQREQQPNAIDEAAEQAVAPTPAQAEAGNYQKGHANIGGLDVSIETPAGGVRKGVGPDGTPWENTAPAHYGYIKRTTGADGDHVDVTLGPKAHEAENHPVFVFDQKDPATGKFDEHKSFMGFERPTDAIDAYDKSFSDGSGPSRRAELTQMSFDEFKDWARNGDTTKALKYKPTVSDQLKAKRAANKAKMAKPGEPQRGVVATVEAPETPVEAGEPRTREQTMGEIQRAVESTRPSIVPLKKGDDVGRIIDQVMKELGPRLAKASTEGDMLELVSKWARSKADPLPGTRTRRLEIGDQIMRKLTGKTVDEFSGRAERLSRDVAREPRPSAVYESEGAAKKADVEAAHAREQDQTKDTSTTVGETSEGVTQAFEGEERPEPQKIVDKLPWWLDRVLNGQMSVHEADQAYGRGSKTRPRKHAAFADYLDERIRQAEDPAISDKLRELLSKTSRKTDQAKSAESVQIERMLDQTGKDFADKLRDLKGELDPVAEAADNAQPKRSHADVMADLKARNAARKAGEPLGRADTSYSRAMNDPRVNRVVDELLDRGGWNPKPRSVFDYLNAIVDDPVIRTEVPAASQLAQRLRSAMRQWVDVEPMDQGYGRAGVFAPTPRPGAGRISLLRGAKNSRLETLLHEALHAVTSHYIDSLPDGHADRHLLDAIHEELSDAANAAAERGQLSPAAVEDIQYALTNAHEMHTMLMSNPHLQQLAANHVPSSQFRMRMHGLGYPLQAAKSAWAAFTAFVRKAIGLKGLPTDTDASFLDHIMRPTQDIFDRAAEYNRQGERSFMGNSAAGDVTDLAAQALARKDTSEIKDAVIRKANLSTLGDKTMRGVLQMATLDGIVDHNAPIFESGKGNSLRDYRSASEAIQHRSKQFRDAFSDRVTSWASSIQGSSRDALAKLIVDGTTADVRLGDLPADANAHLTTPEQQQARAALQKRYDTLPKKAQDAYDASVRMQGEMYAQDRAAKLSGMLKGALPESTPEQREAITKLGADPAKWEKFLDDPDNSDAAAKFGSEWKSVSGIIKNIGELHDHGFISGDYFPLRRDGDYVVSYGERDTPSYGVEMFPTIAAAEARRDELVKQGIAKLSPVMSKRESHLRDMVNLPAIDEIASAMRRRGETDDRVNNMRDLMASVVLQHATHSAGARARIRRQGVLGASTEVEKVAARHMDETAGRIGFAEHGIERSQALQRMQDHTDSLGSDGRGKDQRVAQAVTNELQKRVPVGDDGSGLINKLLRKASPFGFVQSLMTPSTMLTHTIEAHMNSVPLMGARHGAARASLELAKALRDTAPVLGKGVKNVIKALPKGMNAADWNLSNVVRDRAIARGMDKGQATRLFNEWNNAGLIDHSFSRELVRIANPASNAGKWWGRFLDLNAAGAHAVDVANKTTIGLAAYRMELAKTGDETKARAYATDTIRKAIPNYNYLNKPRLATAQGPLGGLAVPMSQFKIYGAHMYTMMANLVHGWTHGATPEARREARYALLGILATHGAMAGVFGLIGDPIRWLGGAYDLVTGADKPHDYQNDGRRMLADVFGPQAGELISRGLPHALGMDIHRRIELSNALEAPDLEDFSKKGWALAAVQAVTGASGEDATTVAGGLSKLAHGDIEGGLKDMIPRIVRDPFKAYTMATDGIKDSKGKTILDPGKLSALDVGYQAVGIQPSRVTEFREARAATLEARDETKSARSALVQAWVSAKPDDREAAHDEIRAYNHANPGAKITTEQLLQARQRAKTENAPSKKTLYGLQVPKNQARALGNAGSFANTQ